MSHSHAVPHHAHYEDSSGVLRALPRRPEAVSEDVLDVLCAVDYLSLSIIIEQRWVLRFDYDFVRLC